MTIHDYNGFHWSECDDCGTVLSGERPDHVGSHWVKPVYSRCYPRCELFCEYDSNGNVVKYKGQEVKKNE